MTTAYEAAWQKLLAATREQSTDMILSALTTIGGAFEVSQEVRSVRTALLTVYEEREGGEAVDALMDVLGMGA